MHPGVHQIFIAIDADKSGSITAEEFKEALRRKGNNLPEVRVWAEVGATREREAQDAMLGLLCYNGLLPGQQPAGGARWGEGGTRRMVALAFVSASTICEWHWL